MKTIKIILLVVIGIILAFAAYLFLGRVSTPKRIIWGVNFSQKHSQNLGLDWRETYLALIDELKVKNIKIAVHWDVFEPEENRYNLADLDWQIKTAEEKGIKVTLVIGMKTSRWPECHIPNWAVNRNKFGQQERITAMIETIVSRYKDSPTIKYWQIENEPLFNFGQCPWMDRDFLKKEIVLVKSIDPSHPILITDTGEWSFWIKAAMLGDIVGTTMYRKVWFEKASSYLNYSFPPVFYGRKAFLIKNFFRKKVICSELQAEPWGPKLLYDVPIEEQKKTMNLDQFRSNIRYAEQSGLDEFYLWGGEWWFWLKQKGYPEIWEEAKKIILIRET